MHVLTFDALCFTLPCKCSGEFHFFLFYSVVKFKIPPKGFYGLNCDGGHGAKDHPNMSVIGGIVRDSDCKWHYGYNQLYPSSEEQASNISERNAVLEGLPKCVEKKFRKLIVYSDNLHLVNALKKRKKLLKHWDKEAMLKILGFKESFDILKFEYVPREGNRAAHCLAKIAYKHLNYEGELFNEPPKGEDELLQILEDDKNQVGIVRK